MLFTLQGARRPDWEFSLLTQFHSALPFTYSLKHINTLTISGPHPHTHP